jgi:hypothetical protein
MDGMRKRGRSMTPPPYGWDYRPPSPGRRGRPGSPGWDGYRRSPPRGDARDLAWEYQRTGPYDPPMMGHFNYPGDMKGGKKGGRGAAKGCACELIIVAFQYVDFHPSLYSIEVCADRSEASRWAEATAGSATRSASPISSTLDVVGASRSAHDRASSLRRA